MKIMFQVSPDKANEFVTFFVEMYELIGTGILRNPLDFQLWIEDVQGECIYCFKELSEIVNKHIKFLLIVN